jgi:hypothetical protein
VIKSTKFYDYVTAMNIYELNRLRKYIYSPLYNEDERLKKFVDVFLPAAKTNSLALMDEKDVWKQVFGNVKYDRAKFVRLLSDTVKKIEHFLVIDRFQQQREMQYAWQLEIMNERKLNKHVPELLNYAERKHEAPATRNADYYYRNFLLQQQKNLHLEIKDQRSAEKNLNDVVSSLDNYYLIQKLKYSAAILHYKNFLSVESELPLLHEILKLTANSTYQIPAIQIYRYIILSFTEPENESNYSKLKELLFANGKLFPTEELKSMFVFAMNYCINQINFGKTTYLREVLSLYQYALQNELLLEDGYLSQWDYKNIVTVALRVKDFKWAAQFIRQYKAKLPKTDRQNAYTFNQARYYFSLKKYDEVLALLQNVKYNDIFYQLDSKTTLLKTYYEMGEWMPLYSLKDSFRVLLRRKRLISNQQKDNYNNLLKLALKLFKSDVKDTRAIQALRDEIQSTGNVADKSWLMEKVEELI